MRNNGVYYCDFCGCGCGGVRYVLYVRCNCCDVVYEKCIMNVFHNNCDTLVEYMDSNGWGRDVGTDIESARRIKECASCKRDNIINKILD